MSEFLSWQGWGFSGALVSALGSIATIVFAYKASTAAKSAKEAADEASKQTSKTLVIFEMFSELERLVSSLESSKISVEIGQWGDAAKQFSSASKMANKIAASLTEKNDSVEKEIILEVVDQTQKLEIDCMKSKTLNPDQIADIQGLITSLIGSCTSAGVAIRRQDDRVKQ